MIYRLRNKFRPVIYYHSSDPNPLQKKHTLICFPSNPRTYIRDTPVFTDGVRCDTEIQPATYNNNSNLAKTTKKNEIASHSRTTVLSQPLAPLCLLVSLIHLKRQECCVDNNKYHRHRHISDDISQHSSPPPLNRMKTELQHTQNKKPHGWLDQHPNPDAQPASNTTHSAYLYLCGHNSPCPPPNLHLYTIFRRCILLLLQYTTTYRVPARGPLVLTLFAPPLLGRPRR